MWFGGGNLPRDGSIDLANRQTYVLDTAGTITPLELAPIGLGITQSIVTVDPVGGDYLVFGDGGTFHTYDITTDTWHAQSASNIPIFSPTRSDAVWHVSATPISTYGVVFFAKFYYGSPSQAWVYLYNHSERSSVESETRAGSSGNNSLFASPNPIHTSTFIRASGPNGKAASVKVYDIKGREVADLSKNLKAGGRAAWTPSGLSAGVYIVKAVAGNRSLSRTLLYQP